jgi:hypothetical protein
LADGGFVPGVEPLRPLARFVLQHLKFEVLDVLAHLIAKAAGLIMERAPDDKNSSPECPVGLDHQETFTERDKTRNV